MNLFELVGTIAIAGAMKAQNDIDNTNDKAKNFGTTMKNGIKTAAKWGAAIGTAAVGATTALAKMATSSASTADNIDKMSQKIGISREAYQELDFICSQSGTTVDSLQVGMKSLTTAMSGAAKGTKSNIEQFKKLGVSVTNADGTLRSQEDVLFDTISALQKMDNQTEKARLTTQLFGKSGTDLMPLLNGAAGSIEEMKNKAHELGLVLDDETIDNGVELTDTMDQMKRAISSLVTKLGAALMPILTRACNYVINNLPTIQKIFDKLAPALTDFFDDVLPALTDLASDLLPVLMNLFSSLLPVFTKLAKSVLPIISNLLETIVPPIAEIVETLLPVLKSALDILIPIFNAVLAVVKPILKVISAIVQPIASLAGGLLTALGNAFGFVKEKTDPAIEAAKEEAKQMREVKKAADDARAAINEKATSELASVASTESLWKELQTLADEQGNVAEKDKARAEFITNQLSEALGIEIGWTGNQITNYQNLQSEIDKTIEKKKAEILLAASEEQYKEAIQKRSEAEATLTEKLSEREESLNNLKAIEAEMLELQEAGLDNTAAYNRMEELEELHDREKAIWKEKNSAYLDAKQLVKDYRDDITKYETATTLMLQGETAKAAEYLSNKGEAFKTAADLAEKSAEDQKAILKQQMEDAALSLNKEVKLLNGLSKDCTAEERATYEKSLKEAQEHFKKAAAEYKKSGAEIGTDFFTSISEKMSSDQFKNIGYYLIEGIASGCEGNKLNLMTKLKGIMNEAVAATANAAEIHSPSRLFARKIGAFIPSGIGKGIEDNEEDAIKPVQDIITDMTQVDGQKVGKSAIQSSTSSTSSENSSGGILEKMDALIQQIKGLKIYLNNDVMVGELAPAMDAQLGKMFVASERGR